MYMRKAGGGVDEAHGLSLRAGGAASQVQEQLPVLRTVLQASGGTVDRCGGRERLLWGGIDNA